MLINVTNVAEILKKKRLYQFFLGLVDFRTIFLLIRLLSPRVGQAVQMVPTTFQQKSVRVFHAHFVPRCM